MHRAPALLCCLMLAACGDGSPADGDTTAPGAGDIDSALAFYEAWYALACDRAVDCDSDPDVIDGYCNTDVAEFSAFETTDTLTEGSDCSYNADLARDCLDAPIECDDGDLAFANVCLAVFSCD